VAAGVRSAIRPPEAGSATCRRAANRRLHTGTVSWGALLTIVLCAGCVELDQPTFGHTTQMARVGDYLTSTCSTSVVRGLSLQIADEVACMLPGALVELGAGLGIEFSGPQVLPYLSQVAVDDLHGAAAALDRPLVINSAYRTVAQQYLLYEWFRRGRCGITAAAPPGGSNHESGRALDIANWSEWVATLGAHGWGHTVPGDEVHFDHLDSPDIRGADVHAFQRLWNRNRPDDPIAEDGDYGPQTALRLTMAPAEGFPLAGCAVEEIEDDDDEDAGEAPADRDLSGGCATGGGAGWLAALGLLAMLLWGAEPRRRKARFASVRRRPRPAGTCT
jgi:hypothetical protein